MIDKQHLKPPSLMSPSLLQTACPVRAEFVVPFDTEDFQTSWLETMGRQPYIEAHDHGLVLSCCHIFRNVLPIRAISPTGWNADSYFDWTWERTEALKRLNMTHRWDYAEVTVCQGRKALQDFEALKKLGYNLVVIPKDPHHVIDTHLGWEAYLAGKTKNTRKHIRKKLQAVEPYAPELILHTDPVVVSELLEWFFELNIKHWQAKTGYAYLTVPGFMDLYRQWFPKLLAQGQLVASELKLSGKTANLQFGVQIDGRIHSIFTINTGVHLDLYPNIVGMYLRIKDACNKGVQCIDLDYGAFPHKLQAETHQEEYCRVLFANPKSLLGLFYVSYQMVKNRNKVRFHL